MTVRELLDELRDRDPELEVYVSVEDEGGELDERPLTGASVQFGRLFLNGEWA